MFKSIGKSKDIASSTRLSGRDIASILKRPTEQRLIAMNVSRGMSRDKAEAEADAKAKTASYSGHSLLRGLITSLAEAGVATHYIQKHSRHKTTALVAEYVQNSRE